MNRGLTLVELLIFGACLMLLLAIVFGASTTGNQTLSFGVNGITETRCVNGYLHTIGEGGNARQVIGENGGGVRCE